MNNKAISTKSLLKILLLITFTLLTVSLVGFTQKTSALGGNQFDPGRIIDDGIFYNEDSMSTSEIQAFLNTKVSDCDTNGGEIYSGSTTRGEYGASKGYPPPYTCLKGYTQVVPDVINGGSDLCAQSIIGGNKTAAQIIHDVGKACGINPQVLIVLLQKEQSLVTDEWPWPSQYQIATGYGCPDTAPCDEQYYGFFNQVYQAAKAYRRYEANPNSYNYKAGRNNYVYYHPSLGVCGGSTIFIQNQATANLYIYTPYQPNQAALDNLYGTGDGCSAYGNRNFWRLFNDWFGSTTQSLLFKISGSNAYYLEWSDEYYPIPNEEMLKAYGLETIAPRVENSFPDGKPRGPALQRAAKFGSDDPLDPDYTAQVDIVDGGKYHGAPNWPTLTRHGITGWANYDSTLKYLLQEGDDLRPLVRKSNGAIYLLESNKKRGFSSWESLSNLSGPNFIGVDQIYSEQDRTNMTNDYINSKTDSAPMLLDGDIISAVESPAIFLYENGQKRLLTVQSYLAWGGKTDFSFSSSAVSAVSTGTNAPFLVKSATENYIASSGEKYSFSSAVLTKWGLTTDDFEQISDRALSKLSSAGPISDLIQGSGPGIYWVDGQEKHGIPSSQDFSRLGFSWDSISRLDEFVLSILPRGADAYAPGALVRTPNGAVFMINSNYSSLGVTSGELFIRYGLNWPEVKNVSSNGLSGFGYDNLKTTLYALSQDTFYLVESGVYHTVPSELADATVYSLNALSANTVDPKVLDFLSKGDDMTRFLRGSGPTVYYVENGQKRPFTTESAFYSKGGNWNIVMDVSDSFLDEIPRGPLL